MSYRYCEAFAEVDYILTGLKENEREQIPKNLRDVIHEKKAENYKFNIDLTKSLFEQNLKNETLAVLGLIYRKYLSDSENREELERHYKETLEEPVVQNVKRNNLRMFKKEEKKSECVQLCKIEEISLWNKVKKMWNGILNKIKKTVK